MLNRRSARPRWRPVVPLALGLSVLTLAAGCSQASTPTATPSSVSSTTPAPAPSTPTTDGGASDNGGADDPAATDDSTATTNRPRQPASAEGGPIVLVTLGDSLTAGQGEDPERGYPLRLQDALDRNGHPGSTVVNLGRSGWTSQQVIDGADGDRGQLPAAEEAIAQAKAEGTPVIATLLIGSNDLWYLYNNEAPTSADEERADLDRYRENLQRILRTLKAAGASVAIAINDDQSKRPVMTDKTLRDNTFGAITDDEVAKMSAQAEKYAGVVRSVAADNDAIVVDFLDAPLFRDPARLNEDGGHPNARGYDEMTEVWLAALQPLL